MISQKRSINDVVDELISIKEQDGRAERYLRDLRARLNRFAGSESFRSRSIQEIESREIDDWLRGLPGGAVNRKN